MRQGWVYIVLEDASRDRDTIQCMGTLLGLGIEAWLDRHYIVK